VVHVPAVQRFTGGGPQAETLSTQMQGAWLSFARTGDPAHAGVGSWPAWDPVTRSTMVFGTQTGALDRPRDPELSVWERFRPLFPGQGTTEAGSRALAEHVPPGGAPGGEDHGT
jgi:hypothetical protein